MNHQPIHISIMKYPMSTYLNRYSYYNGCYYVYQELNNKDELQTTQSSYSRMSDYKQLLTKRIALDYQILMSCTMWR